MVLFVLVLLVVKPQDLGMRKNLVVILKIGGKRSDESNPVPVSLEVYSPVVSILSGMQLPFQA